MKKKFKRVNWPRMIIQWGVILFILILVFRQYIFKNHVADFEAYCPFGGLQALGSFFLSQSLSCTMTTMQIVMGILLFAGVIIFSKLFCSFICPLGTVGEWLGKLGDKLKMRFTITGKADLALRFLKYALLFITVYFTLQSNELFCKKFDPYYASVTGFDTDVNVLYAVIAIAVLILGSLFVRLFWCKYLCPLGALSNIFKFAGFFIVIMAAYLIALKAGAAISYVWPLAILCAGGFIIEVSRLKSWFVPVVKITRNAPTCIDCGLCAKKCHQAIDVDKVDVVRHVDCNLCGDCVLVCPVKNTLQVNRRNSLKWISPIAVVLLVAAGLSLGSLWELPTIDQRWFDKETMGKAEIYEQSGLKNIKCFGSSTSFANQMRKVDGVLGVATFVKEHRVKIWYDPEKLDTVKLQEVMFAPDKTVLRPIAPEVDSITVVKLTLENFFDPYDFIYLTQLLEQKTSATGLVSEFGCPPIVKICFPSDSLPGEETLKTILESKKLTYGVNGSQTTVKLGYKVASRPELSKTGRSQYIRMLFVPFDMDFNDRKAYSDSVVSIYEVPLGQNAKLWKRFSFLVSHLSQDDGVVEFRTDINPEEKEVAHIFFVDTITNAGNIFKALAADSLVVSYSTGETRKLENMFSFETIGTVLPKEQSIRRLEN